MSQIALSLRGHGGSSAPRRLRFISFADYLQDVAAAATDLPTPPVLVGHSMGGYVVQKYLETNHAPAGVLLASVPRKGAVPLILRWIKLDPWPVVKALLTGRTLPFVGSSVGSRIGGCETRSCRVARPPSFQAFMPTAWGARPLRSRSTFTNVRDGRHLLVWDCARRTHKLLKTGEDTRIPLHHMAVSGHPVVANIRVPSWVDWNRYRGAIRRLCRDPRRGVPRTPAIGTGMGGAGGQLQTGAPQTGRHQGSRCYADDECSFHVAGSLFSLPPAP